MLKSTQPEKVGFSEERLQRISTVMQGYVDRGQTGAILTLVERKGEIVHFSKSGYQDIETQKPVEFDSLLRIYSMTKPIVSLGLMMLYEEAKFHLHDPVHMYLPEFKHIKVWGPGGKLVNPDRFLTIQHLLTHTAGLTYGESSNADHDKLFEEAKIYQPGIDLQEMVKRIASVPLAFHPGERWFYSVATDVAGRLIEVLSGETLESYLKQRIFQPLKMEDTSFSVPDEKLDRFMTCYTDDLDLFDGVSDSVFRNVTCYKGGGGLVSTLKDYLQFARLIRGKGTLGSTTLVSRKTIDLMTQNHIVPQLMPLEAWKPFPGFGFGLGFSVTMDVAKTGLPGSIGNIGWVGMANTIFWIDPREELIAIMATQWVSENRFRFEDDFRTLVYQALLD
ncbi:MAG: beta-lactamase family protein [Anaerolineaceae bacterium]|nr:beta-lactamase family protein [Anaerolineaceae bacterium]